jgi:hypothetical protein
MLAMRMEAKVFGNDEVPADEFDLLKYLWHFFRNGKFAFAFRTGFEFEFDGLVDLIVGEGLALLGFMSFLCSDFAFASSVFVFGLLGRFNDVGGRRLGGIGGVLFETGNFIEGYFQQCFEFGNAEVLFCNVSILFGNASVFGIHRGRIAFLRF